jgi:predicted SprT family Zn-dependent metalloprotease
MQWPKIAQRVYKGAQLLFQFDVDPEGALVGSSRCDDRGRRSAPTLPFSDLSGRELLRSLGADELARKIRVEWNPRMRSAAGRADFRGKLISLNPLLINHSDEIDRTLRHELAHLLAQWRVGRRRIAPHGIEWRQACRDLGIADEARCHNLPFAAKTYSLRYVYRCPNCKERFPRFRRIRRAIACLACCRAHNRGEFDPRFRLKLTTRL